MRLAPKLLVSLAFSVAALAAGPVMAAGNPDHSAEIAKFKSSCAAQGGTFSQVSRTAYRCTAKNGAYEQCNYSGTYGWCSGVEVAPPPTSTGAHRRG